jgi:molybdopterin/thiamine biosynthesis adenylyltransferase
MIYSTALTSDLDAKARDHLIRADGQEDLCFALWNPSTGLERKTAILTELILPKDNEREVHGNVAFFPNYFERAVGMAFEKGLGLAFIHSHPAQGWQSMSKDDFTTEQEIAAATRGATGLPLVGLTLGTDGAWSSRFWEKKTPSSYERHWCSTTRVIGEDIKITFADHLIPPPNFRERLKRTISAWGKEKQQSLARFTFGIVGTGSVGSIVAETLARMGISHIKLIDFDVIEEINLDRLLHVTEKDIGSSKIQVIASAIRKTATAEKIFVEEVPFSIVEETGFKKALDCDVLFCCVDRPWPRSVLNLIAYAHLIPVIDGGISIQTSDNGKLQGADWKAHVVSPSRRCLECLEQFNPEDVQLEREGRLDDPSYIETLHKKHHLRRNENVFSFSTSLASFEILQMLSMVIAPLGLSNNGEFLYHFVTGNLDITWDKVCANNCIYQKIIGMGDTCPYVVTGKHERAEQIRNSHSKKKLFSRIYTYLFSK